MFSLRTSDCSHLIEACNFYAAIRSRGYFNLLSKDMRSSLVIKKLRYFARYIVVCLLLKRLKMVKELIREFAMALDDYSHVYEPEAQLEWSLVFQEIKAFVEADSLVSVLTGPQHPSGPGHVLGLSQRVTSSNVPAPLKMPLGKLTLSECLIVGNYQRQVKFSELTIDMYRILQILEREPSDPGGLNGNNLSNNNNNSNNNDNQQQQQATTTTQTAIKGASTAPFNLLTRPSFQTAPNGGPNNQSQQQQTKLSSPHKYLLFRPNFSQLFLFLASGFKELPPNGVMLLYVSADGSFGGQMNIDCEDSAYELGGLATNPNATNPGQSSQLQQHFGRLGANSVSCRLDLASSPMGQAATQLTTANGQMVSGSNSSHLRRSQSSLFKQLNCLHPGDLLPFTRKPLVLIIDSNNSYAFQQMRRHFGSPLVVLMSPTDYPAPFNDNTKGSLFSLFLHCPITALCSISNIIELPEPIWRESQLYLEKFYLEMGTIILQSRLIDPSFISLCNDDFLRLIIFRFIFCYTIMRLHRLFRNTNHLPRSYPCLPDLELIQHPVIKQIISDLTVTLDIRSLFD